MTTGTERWRVRTGGAVDSSPAVAGGTVYALSRDGRLYAVDSALGTVRWSFETGSEQRLDFWDFYLSDPLVHGGHVIFGSGDGSVYALDQHTGALAWRFETGEIVHAAPIAAEGMVYVGGFDGVLYALHLESGDVAWQFETEGNPSFPKGELQRAAALRDGVLYVGSRDYHIYAIDAADGRMLWRKKEGNGWIVAPPLVTEDAVYFGASDGQRFYGLDRSTGAVSWSLPVHTRVFGAAVLMDDAGGGSAANEVMVFGGFNGMLFAVEPTTGAVQWRFQTPTSRSRFATVYEEEGVLNAEMRALYRTSEGFLEAEARILTLGSIPGTPAIRGTMVYFSTTEGILYALDTSSGR